jgi:hypothetical protein
MDVATIGLDLAKHWFQARQSSEQTGGGFRRGVK